ncbi:MAG: LysR family transcriptional regulator [Oscillospiraceae bacterium]|nr:LysR family transcriptional regulator [Oscillospiraceae bacterium]
MELQQIKQFREIARTENISKAAETLGLTQATLSQNLKRLEDELGVQLFERVGKRLVINKAGEIMYRHCDEICSTIDTLTAELAEYKGEERKAITIAFEDLTEHIPEILNRLNEQLPEIQVRIASVNEKEWNIRLFSSISNKGMQVRHWSFTEDMGVVIHRDSPLAKQGLLHKIDLINSSFINYAPYEDIVQYYCRREDFCSNTIISVDTKSVMIDLMKRNMGVAFLPQNSWQQYFGDELVFKTVADLPIQRELYLATRNTWCRNDEEFKCLEILQDYFNGVLRI